MCCFTTTKCATTNRHHLHPPPNIGTTCAHTCVHVLMWMRPHLCPQFFEREIEIMATIRHPNVVNFIGACHTPPNVCLVTEYCARGSLDHLLHKSGGWVGLASCTQTQKWPADAVVFCVHLLGPGLGHTSCLNGHAALTEAAATDTLLQCFWGTVTSCCVCWISDRRA